jgi:hypothetical protein
MRAASSCRRSDHSAAPSRTSSEMSLDRFAREFRHRDSSQVGLMPEPSVEVVGELDRRPLHGMPAYQGRRYTGSPTERRPPPLDALTRWSCPKHSGDDRLQVAEMIVDPATRRGQSAVRHPEAVTIRR